MQIILASTSKTRQTILSNAGIDFKSHDSKLEETAPRHSMRGSSPKHIAEALAFEKARRVSETYPDTLVIGADQTLGLGDQVFSKPNSIEEASEQLTKLRGATHKLFSAVACLVNGKIIWSHCGEAELTMRNFSEAFLQAYLKSIAHTYAHSVGGYQLEGEGINLFEQVDGDYFTILGLPLLPLLAFLRQQHITQS